MKSISVIAAAAAGASLQVVSGLKPNNQAKRMPLLGVVDGSGNTAQNQRQFFNRNRGASQGKRRSKSMKTTSTKMKRPLFHLPQEGQRKAVNRAELFDSLLDDQEEQAVSDSDSKTIFGGNGILSRHMSLLQRRVSPVHGENDDEFTNGYLQMDDDGSPQGFTSVKGTKPIKVGLLTNDEQDKDTFLGGIDHTTQGDLFLADVFHQKKDSQSYAAHFEIEWLPAKYVEDVVAIQEKKIEFDIAEFSLTREVGGKKWHEAADQTRIHMHEQNLSAFMAQWTQSQKDGYKVKELGSRVPGIAGPRYEHAPAPAVVMQGDQTITIEGSELNQCKWFDQSHKLSNTLKDDCTVTCTVDHDEQELVLKAGWQIRELNTQQEEPQKYVDMRFFGVKEEETYTAVFRRFPSIANKDAIIMFYDVHKECRSNVVHVAKQYKKHLELLRQEDSKVKGKVPDQKKSKKKGKTVDPKETKKPVLFEQIIQLIENYSGDVKTNERCNWHLSNKWKESLQDAFSKSSLDPTQILRQDGKDQYNEDNRKALKDIMIKVLEAVVDVKVPESHCKDLMLAINKGRKKGNKITKDYAKWLLFDGGNYADIVASFSNQMVDQGDENVVFQEQPSAQSGFKKIFSCLPSFSRRARSQPKGTFDDQVGVEDTVHSAVRDSDVSYGSVYPQKSSFIKQMENQRFRGIAPPEPLLRSDDF